MSAKELKSLKDQHEQLREAQRLKTEIIKQTRMQIRQLTNNINSKNQEIASLEARVGQPGEMFNESSGVLTPKELETYSNAFSRIAFNQLFEPISERVKPSKVKKLKKMKEEKKETITSVDVQFENVKISFFVSFGDTFQDLRKQVASYWSLPIDEIFFSDGCPDDGIQQLFLLKQEIIKELYVWRQAKVKSGNFLLYLVLRNYTSLKERMDQLFPKSHEGDIVDHETDDPVQRLMGLSKKKDKGSQDINKEEEFKKRKKWTKIQFIIQWALFLTLFLLWTFMISSDKDVEKSSWINKKLIQTFLWNTGFDDIEAIGLYGAASTSSFFTVTSISKMWDYINSLQMRMYSDGDYGILENYLYSLQYIEIRQLRTKEKSCDFHGIFNYTCTKEYQVVLQSYEKDLNDSVNGDYETYTTRATSIYVYGDLAYYPNGGYLNNLDIQDNIEWVQNITNLQNQNWIDDGTRAVMITLNVYNPSSDIITMIMPYFEISASGTFVQNFKIYSIKMHPYSTAIEISHAFIMIIIVILLALEIRQNLRHENEIDIFVFNSPPGDPEKIYEQIREYSQQNFFKRLKKPKIDQLLSIITLIFALILEILNLSLYFGYFEQDIKVKTGYNNLFGALQGVAILNDAKTLMILFFAFNVLRYIIIWMSDVSKFFKVIVQVFSHIGQYVFLNLLPLLIFSLFLYYFLGPCDIAFNTIERSFLSTIRAFCGHWPTSRNFQYFTDSGNLVLIYFVFIVWRALVLSFQAILFQMELFKSMMKMTK